MTLNLDLKLLNLLVRFFYALLFTSCWLLSNQAPKMLYPIPQEETEYNLHAEGFLTGTFIKTPNGYTPIEQLDQYDVISCKQTDQIVTYVSKIPISHYFKLQIENDIIYAAPGQKFYLINGTIKTAAKITSDDILENNYRIFGVEKIYDPTTSYYFSTQESSFTIYPNIHVHNFNVLTFGSTAFSISLGVVECSNPIIAATGGIMILGYFATEFFKKYIAFEFEFDDKDPDLTAQNLSLQNDATTQSTRDYYTFKRKQLIELQQSLILLKNNIIQCLANTPISSSKLLQECILCQQTINFQNILLPDISYETGLSSQQKQQLLTSRDADLQKIEHEIVNITFSIALYINQLIQQHQDANHVLKQISTLVNQEVNNWNYDASNVPSQVAINHYAIHLIWDQSLKTLEQCCQENLLIFTYLHTLANNIFLEKISNIQSLSLEELKLCQKDFDNIKLSKTIFLHNMKITEDYLRKHNLLTPDFIHTIKLPIQQQSALYEKDILECTKKKKHQIASAIQEHLKNQPTATPPDPKKPDENPDDWFEKLKKNYAKKGCAKHFGNIYKDSKTGLWYSKDRGGIRAHGGEHYKVFKETARGLDCIYQVDKLGNIINKHKGPIGMFIPYSDIIF